MYEIQEILSYHFIIIQFRDTVTPMETLFVYGTHPVEEALLRTPEKVHKIYIKDGQKGSDTDRVVGIARDQRIPFVYVPEAVFIEKVGRVVHQGIMGELAPIEYTDLKSFLEDIDVSSNPAVVLLDELTDPHNVGAIIRSAAAFGMSAIIIPKHRQAPITGTVYKTSAGTLGAIPVIRITNINQTIDTLKEKGFWIYGLSEDANQSVSDTVFDTPVCFIVGNEGHGIREKTLERADITLRIPMENGVDSLNASVAAAIMMYQWHSSMES